MQPTVEVSHLGMKFNLSQEMHDTLKDYFINLFAHHQKMKKDEFWALSDVSFKLYPGDRLGILGLNGAGKSTILKAIAGVYHPTTGYVKKKGKLAPLLELGAGFEPQYSARENIFLYGSILGYKKEFIQSKFDEIIDFAELRDFIEVPVKNYSSGMKSRLGFAICTAVNPDILILDEVLSVGDKKFRRKSEDKMMSMFDGNVTVLFVSHSLDKQVRLHPPEAPREIHRGAHAVRIFGPQIRIERHRRCGEHHHQGAPAQFAVAFEHDPDHRGRHGGLQHLAQRLVRLGRLPHGRLSFRHGPRPRLL